MFLKVFALSIFCLAHLTVLGQDTRNSSSTVAKPRFGFYKKEKKRFLGFLKKENEANYKTHQEELLALRARVSKAQKENAKEEYRAYRVKNKEAKKGVQFHGHKRPPKKRPPRKQKFCKICKIKH